MYISRWQLVVTWIAELLKIIQFHMDIWCVYTNKCGEGWKLDLQTEKTKFGKNVSGQTSISDSLSETYDEIQKETVESLNNLTS